MIAKRKGVVVRRGPKEARSSLTREMGLNTIKANKHALALWRFGNMSREYEVKCHLGD